jgi:hypothetical protein
MLIASLVALAGLIFIYYLRRRAVEIPRFPIKANATDLLSPDILLPEDPQLSDATTSVDRRREAANRERHQKLERTRPSGSPRLPPIISAVWSDPGLIMQIVLSLTVIGAGLYMILSGRYDASNQHWAYGIVGTVVGFWLKGAK